MVVLSTWSSYFADGKPRSSLSYSASQGASCGRIARPDSKHAVCADARTYFSSRGFREIKLKEQLGRSTCRSAAPELASSIRTVVAPPLRHFLHLLQQV